MARTCGRLAVTAFLVALTVTATGCGSDAKPSAPSGSGKAPTGIELAPGAGGATKNDKQIGSKPLPAQ